MNRFESSNKQSDSIRSEIDETRHRMDSTIDALTERLKGRHLLDELLGFLRSGNGTTSALKTKVSEATSSTVHAVVDTVKSHPLPILAIGAGLAWLIYERERKAHGPSRSYAAFEPEPRDPVLAPEPLDYEDYSPGYGTEGGALGGSEFADVAEDSTQDSSLRERAGETKERLQARASDAKQRVQHRAAELGQRARAGLRDMKDRTTQATAQMRERSREIAARTKDQVSRTAREHPIETGLTCLAVGILAGMLTPAPQRIRQEVAPVAQRLKQRARDTGQDLVERGKRVVAAAGDAARHEAQNQGLTPEAVMAAGKGQNRQPGSGRGHEDAVTRPAGDWPGQTAKASPPTPATSSAMSGDEQKVAADIVQPKPSVPPQPTI